MNPQFVPLTDQKPGTIASLLRASYAGLLEMDGRWDSQQASWEEYDHQVFAHRDTVGRCLFLTCIDGRLVGFGSWDPRRAPRYGIVGHNCILPEFRGHGLGRQKIQEVLRRFQTIGITTARATTCDHPFFAPAQRMYVTCGFREVRRTPWNRDPNRMMIEYERDMR
jgi:GNAT superfamily N-acetyltransferase